ncbi:hypothetical protein NUW58_g6440 [Xylaria curta]|uniref:Uncharacterized protein n=1 Tax=Xylaria curta TaxID=42375 RepID=A0ACC1NU46_9PEZI|nr:hypothetical protein NUW58_g6440 [Xylaria curta]
MGSALYDAQAILHYVYPLVVFIYFAVSSAVVLCALQNPSKSTTPTRFKAIWYSLLIFITLYGVQIVLKIVEILIWSRWPAQSTIIGLLACVLIFGVEQNSFGDAAEIVWYPYYGSWFMASLFEPAIAAIQFLVANEASSVRLDSHPEFELPAFIRLDAVISTIRFAIILSTILIHFASCNRIDTDSSDEERSPLLTKPGQRLSNGNGSADSGYGTSSEATNTDTTNTETANSPTDPESPWERQQRLYREKMEKRLKSEGSWIAYVKGFMVFFPYIWPVGNRRLQIHVVLVGLCLLAGNGLNFLIPRQYGAVLDSLGGASKESPWVQVMIFAGLRILSSEAGLPLIRHLLWMPVEYYSQEALSVAAYSHVMNLSSEFHDSQSSSDIQVAISNGYHITNLLESICFQAIPMVIDLVVAFTYLSVKFGPYEGFITMATGLSFIQSAAQLISKFKEKRKKVVSTYFEEHYTRQAGIQGWYTVSAFNQIPYEERRYSTAVKSQVLAYKSIYTGYLIGQAFQYLILTAGLLAGAFLAVYQITQEKATPGDFVMLLTYWSQLTSPLQFFSTMGRNISQSLVQVERLLEVMLTKPTVVDKPGARDLKLKGGKVEFRNVSFSYDKKKDILKGVKLSAPSGTTVAFVGATGAGKSTIFKVLDRFYDVTGGSILIDGQDIRDVTLSSLRRCIGIVPQSPILFDDTVINNVRYARLDASDEEVYSACKAAAIHDQIMGFTEGKLSGGELQRVAIARAILKNPEIVLLDEATSAVDTDTEQKIQEGLRALCENRTTFIVAHRLSTVMNADIIFVVANGQVVEQGNHEELIAKNGKYAELWSKQIFVKPKERKEDVDVTDTSYTSDELENQAANDVGSEANPSELIGSLSTVEEVELEADGLEVVEGEAGNTPVTRKKEGSRLNPGAPEFTPRTFRATQPAPTSPIHNSWAEDVEDEVISPHKVPMDDNSSGHEWGAHNYTQVPPNTAVTSPNTFDVTIQATPSEISEPRPRRNTSQSASCPDPPLIPLQCSPSPSASQPVPSPRAPSPLPVEGVAPEVRFEVQAQPNEKPDRPKSMITETKAPQATNRGRGSRGRGHRGRYRGKGRRSTSNPKQNQAKRATGAPQSSSRLDSHVTLA